MVSIIYTSQKSVNENIGKRFRDVGTDGREWYARRKENRRIAFDHEGTYMVMLNPEIVKFSGE